MTMGIYGDEARDVAECGGGGGNGEMGVHTRPLSSLFRIHSYPLLCRFSSTLFIFDQENVTIT